MGRVAVVTDSSACLPTEQVSGLGIYVVPLRFTVEGKSCRDGIDITASDLYRLLPRARELPTTSAPSPSDYYAAIQKASVDHESVLIVTIAGRFSSTYQSAALAANTARDSLPDIAVTVVDSGTAAGAEGLVALGAARVSADDGTLEDVCAAARAVAEQVELLATLDTLYYLARSGRVPMAAHWANTLIRVNPLLRILPMSGEARIVRVARGRASAVRQMLELARRRVAGRWMHGVVLHSLCLDEAERLHDQVGREFRCRELYVCDFTPAMGIHTGPGVLGLAYYAED